MSLSGLIQLLFVLAVFVGPPLAKAFSAAAKKQRERAARRQMEQARLKAELEGRPIQSQSVSQERQEVRASQEAIAARRQAELAAWMARRAELERLAQQAGLPQMLNLRGGQAQQSRSTKRAGRGQAAAGSAARNRAQQAQGPQRVQGGGRSRASQRASTPPMPSVARAAAEVVGSVVEARRSGLAPIVSSQRPARFSLVGLSREEWRRAIVLKEVLDPPVGMRDLP